MFDRTIDRSCPIARSSEITVALPSEGTYSVNPEPSAVDAGRAIFDVANSEFYASYQLQPLSYSCQCKSHSTCLCNGLQISNIVSCIYLVVIPSALNKSYIASGFDTPITSLSVQRTLRGSSQARGQLSVIVKNHSNSVLRVVYLETMPWLVQFYLHTLDIRINGVREGMLERAFGNQISFFNQIPSTQTILCPTWFIYPQYHIPDRQPSREF